MEIEAISTYVKNIGDIIQVKMNPSTIEESENEYTFSKQLIIGIDVSFSMSEHSDHIKALIKYLLDQFNKIRKVLDVSIIIFNDKTTEIWNGFSKNTYTECIDQIQFKGLSNLGKGFQDCLDRSLKNKYTWIILIGDGIPTKGPIRAAESFQKIEIPKRTKILTYGFHSCDEEILAILGKFNFKPELEDMQLLAQEILTTNIFNITVNFISDKRNIDLNSLILEMDSFPKGKVLSGKLYYFNQPDTIVYLPYGNMKDDELLSSYKIIVSYYSIQEKYKSIEISIDRKDGIKDLSCSNLKENYYKLYLLLKEKLRTDNFLYELEDFKQTLKETEILDYIEEMLQDTYITNNWIYQTLVLSQ